MKERHVVRPDRVRTVPESFSWIDREILHSKYLEKLTCEETLLYFFLALVAGPEGTSFWGYRRIAKILKLSEVDILEATRGLIAKDLIDFRFPTYQVLSIRSRPETERGEGQ